MNNNVRFAFVCSNGLSKETAMKLAKNGITVMDEVYTNILVIGGTYVEMRKSRLGNRVCLVKCLAHLDRFVDIAKRFKIINAAEGEYVLLAST